MVDFTVPIKDAQLTLSTTVGTLATDTMSIETPTSINSTKKFVDLVLTCSFAAGIVTAGNTIDVFRRDINIDGVNDSDLPVVDDYEEHYVGSFKIPVVALSTSVTMALNGIYAPNEAEFYFKNASGQTLEAGAVLKGTSWTWGNETA